MSAKRAGKATTSKAAKRPAKAKPAPSPPVYADPIAEARRRMQEGLTAHVVAILKRGSTYSEQEKTWARSLLEKWGAVIKGGKIVAKPDPEAARAFKALTKALTEALDPKAYEARSLAAMKESARRYAEENDE